MSDYSVVKLVRSVVAERDLIPVMTHFHLYEGRIQGTNGKLTLDAPWTDYLREDSINVPAEPFVKAFETMADPHPSLTERHLHLSEGKMRVRIPLSVDAYPRCERPTGGNRVDDDLLRTLRAIRPFISEDASRPWACGALVQDGWAYATNNIVMVRQRLEGDYDDFTLPGFAIDQLGRCDKGILEISIRENAIGFELEDDIWMESTRYAEQWPNVDRFFDWDHDLPRLRGNEKAIVDKLLPFVPDERHPVIRFMGEKIATLEGEMEALVEVDCGEAAFHAVPLQLVLSVATHMDLDPYPKPMPFIGGLDGELEGIIMGVSL